MSEISGKTVYYTIKDSAEAEIEEKKSRFIAHLRHVESAEDATAFILATKKEHWDARHNCYAYILGPDSAVKNCSDDGEPSQTAGRPMLEVLEKNGMTDVVCVVTRYFGGTLLGTGGLVRAYQGAVAAVLDSCEILTMKYGMQLCVKTDYTYIGSVLRLNESMGIRLTDSEYSDVVVLHVWVEVAKTDSYRESVIQSTNGSAVITEEGFIYCKA